MQLDFRRFNPKDPANPDFSRRHSPAKLFPTVRSTYRRYVYQVRCKMLVGKNACKFVCLLRRILFFSCRALILRFYFSAPGVITTIYGGFIFAGGTRLCISLSVVVLFQTLSPSYRMKVDNHKYAVFEFSILMIRQRIVKSVFEFMLASLMLAAG